MVSTTNLCTLLVHVSVFTYPSHLRIPQKICRSKQLKYISIRHKDERNLKEKMANWSVENGEEYKEMHN